MWDFIRPTQIFNKKCYEMMNAVFYEERTFAHIVFFCGRSADILVYKSDIFVSPKGNNSTSICLWWRKSVFYFIFPLVSL